ncbi:olfactory receptor 51E1-like [Hyperolius riggenbachi]|uniref:olfactory receptor 51E1-like n=1 Tax=Hyperolius riggenbachi TaxID=752182 RepID=UPI0035A2F1AC
MMNLSYVYGPIPSQFLLLGLTWLEEQKTLAGFLYLVMYLVVILGNCTIITLVKIDKKLHEPMHIFVSLLAVIDLTVSSTVIPKALAILWCGSNTISSLACLTQMYVVYTMLAAQSSLFALMSFDRYVAICHPLRHSTIMNSSFIIKSVSFIVSRSSLFLIPIPALTSSMTFCKTNILPHSYCECVDVIQLSCGDLTSIVIYMILLICFFPGGDNALVVFSYIHILQVVHMLKSTQARWKSLSTCSSHAILLSMFYMSSGLPLLLFLNFPHPPLYLKTCTKVLSFLLLPMINPIVYGVRTKEIQDGFRRLYWKLFRLNS